MALGERKDPYLSFRFTVEVDQQVVAAFNPHNDRQLVLGDPSLRTRTLSGTFRADKDLLAACLDGYGWPTPDDDWPRQMLAFTLLHDFNMLTPDLELAPYVTLDELADAVWRLEAPGLSRRA